MRALISVIGRNRKKVFAAPVKTQDVNAAISIEVWRGEESIFGIQERPPEFQVHAVAVTEGSCGYQP